MLFQPCLFHLLPECTAAHTQRLGRLDLRIFCTFQCHHQDLAFAFLFQPRSFLFQILVKVFRCIWLQLSRRKSRWFWISIRYGRRRFNRLINQIIENLFKHGTIEFAPGKQDESLRKVLELTDIAGPGIFLESINERGRNLKRKKTVFAGKESNELIQQNRQILKSVSQGRNMDVKDVQPEKQITSEIAISNLGGQVAVGGSNDSHINRNKAVRLPAA